MLSPPVEGCRVEMDLPRSPFELRAIPPPNPLPTPPPLPDPGCVLPKLSREWRRRLLNKGVGGLAAAAPL